jgi:hypothetical protein
MENAMTSLHWTVSTILKDIIDNSQGYIPGNVILISRRANRLKGDATPDELQKLAKFYNSIVENGE